MKGDGSLDIYDRFHKRDGLSSAAGWRQLTHAMCGVGGGGG